MYIILVSKLGFSRINQSSNRQAKGPAQPPACKAAIAGVEGNLRLAASPVTKAQTQRVQVLAVGENLISPAISKFVIFTVKSAFLFKKPNKYASSPQIICACSYVTNSEFVLTPDDFTPMAPTRLTQIAARFVLKARPLRFFPLAPH